MEHLSRQLLKEKKLHGNTAFPLAIYVMEQQGGDIPIVDCHWHNEIEFFFCLEGEVLFQINQEFVHLKAGELLFINSEELHTGHAVPNIGCKFAAIVLDAKLLDSAKLDAIQTKYITPFHEQRKTFPRHFTYKLDWQRQFIHYIEQIIMAEEQKQLGYELLIKANLMLMLQLIYANQAIINLSPSKDGLNVQTERLKIIISYIYEHYQKQISIHELSQLIPMSEGHFCRFFKKMTRQTVTEFINSYRIKQAAILLLETDLKISTIAHEVGFDHISYFVKLFKLHHNCSPSIYRRQRA